MKRRRPFPAPALLVGLLLFSLLPMAVARATDWSTAREGDVRWLRTPDGARFFSIGVNVVDAEPDRAPRRGELQYRWSPAHASPEAWVDATRARLHDWGFNTLGGWARREAAFDLPYTPVLAFGQHVNAIWGDPFSPETFPRMLADAKKKIARHPIGPLRIGYFTDNEIGWWNAPLFFWFLEQSPKNHTRRRLLALVRERYPDFAAFRRDFVVPEGVESFDDLARKPAKVLLAAEGDGIRTLRAWTAILVERYYALAEKAVRTADPGALVLGDRLPIYWDEDALRAAGPYVDVLAVNHDVATPGGWVAPYFFEGLRDLVPRPILVSEWFFASRENRTGNSNRGQLMTVDTQAERARGAAVAARRFAGFPNVAGLHWFQYSDQPPGGRADGEDYSHGLVDVHGEPYLEFATALGVANRALPELHAGSRWEPPPDAAIPILIQPATPGAQGGAGPLDAWNLGETRLRFPRGGDGRDVPFADVHLSFTDDALLVAVIGQEFFDLDLYERDPVPLGDTLALHILVSDEDAKARRHVAIHFEPERLAQSPDFPPSEHSVEVYTPKGYGVAADGEARREPTIRTQRLRAISPRFDAVIAIPRTLLGLSDAVPGAPLDLEVAVVGFLRGRAFTLSGRPIAAALSETPKVRAVLAPTEGEPPLAGTPRPDGTSTRD